MAHRSPHFLRASLLPCVITLALLSGCEDGPPKGASMAGGSRSSTNAQLQNRPDDDLANAEWGEMNVSDRTPAHSRTQPTAPTLQNSGGVAPSEEKPWTIVLATVAGDDAQRSAAQALQSIRTTVPDLASARLLPTHSGIIIAYGAYDDVRDAQAQKDLARIKKIAVRGGRPFLSAVLTRAPSASLAQGPLKPNDLRTARQLHPKVDPLYTLQVGVWSDFDSGQLTPQQVRASAEKQAAELRARGFEAYFYHDIAKVVSIVTVGLFDKNAIIVDPSLKTPVFSEEVEQLLKKFPAHLVNGEPVQELIAPNVPSMGTRVQTPKLVIVPME